MMGLIMNNSNHHESSHELVRQLSELRLSFSQSDAEHKAGIIEKLSGMIISEGQQLIDYHEALCFMQAYPDNAAIGHIVDSELNLFYRRVGAFKIDQPNDNGLDDTGMVDTPIYYPYNLNTVRWVQARFGSAIDIDWDDYEKREADPLCGMLPLFALYLENDGIDDEDSSTADWIKMAIGRGRNALGWLISRLDSLGIDYDLKQYMYDNAELMLRWDLGRTAVSRTLAKLPGHRIHYQRGPFKKERINLNLSLKENVPELNLVHQEAAQEVIETLIRALLPRHRELYPATYANPDEVYVTGPGQGLEIYILGMRPETRMPLESNYSALLIKNGVPIGYGIAVFFFERCELAINVFDSFRSGEAAFIFEHFIKIFYHHFGGRDFLMRRWQVGYDNEEGIQSGSYWFYYKLGFRSMSHAADSLAKKEWEKIQADKNYRTGPKTLKKLAISDMYFSPGREANGPFHELSVIKLALAVTRMIAERFDGDRQAAQCWSTEHIAAMLHVDLGSWTAIEKIQFDRFAPLLTLIKDLPNWDTNDKADLISVIKAKAALRESEYILRLAQHKKFEKALRLLDSTAY
jgi:hypothetical protein